MNLVDFRLLTDENFDPDVVAFLRLAGFDAVDVCERGWQGCAGAILLEHALTDGRVVVAHDSDFGRLAVFRQLPLVGLIYLRPGHIDPQFTIGTLRALVASCPVLTPPFILVAKRIGDVVRTRVRMLSL